MSGNQDGNSESGRQPLEAEVVNPPGEGGASGQGYGGRRGRPSYGPAVSFAAIDNSGCLAAFITFSIFMACLFEWGLLAAIGFIVFHTIGNIFTSIHSAKLLMGGTLRGYALVQRLQRNIWGLRVCNWAISMLVTAWLAGGFD